MVVEGVGGDCPITASFVNVGSTLRVSAGPFCGEGEGGEVSEGKLGRFGGY